MLKNDGCVHCGARRRCKESTTAGSATTAALQFFSRRGIPVPARASQTWLRRFNSAIAFAWVANFGSEVPALNRRELGANPRRPTNFNAPVAQLPECDASNVAVAGESPAGSANFDAK